MALIHMYAQVDDITHNDLVAVMKENSVKSDNPFQKLFWEQQQKASLVKNARCMRWHPLMIKWCLYLRHHSGRAYDTLRESGCVVLPSQRTLRDYTYYVCSSTGFTEEIDKQLLGAAMREKPGELNRYVVLVLDEMYVREDLVYDKHSGALIGFANIELVPYLFSLPGVKVFLSEHLCQDPLEKFFGCQRQRGGTHDNPSVREFCQNTQALRVINSFCRGPVKGNCRIRSKNPDLEKENVPLPKRKRQKKL